MDTREELAMDEWIQEYDGCCATCKYYMRGYCHNEESPYCDFEELSDGCACEFWSQKDFAKARSKRIKKMMEDMRKRWEKSSG